MIKLIVFAVVLPFVTPMLMELWILHRRPEFFARFALWKVGEHTFKLRQSNREGSTLREMRHPFQEGVLIVRKGKSIVRSSLLLSAKVGWVLSVEARRGHDTITLTARRVFVPMSLVLSALLVCAAFLTTQNWVACIAVMLIGTLVVVCGTVSEHDAHIRTMREAFRHLEGEYRALLEVPK